MDEPNTEVVVEEKLPEVVLTEEEQRAINLGWKPKEQWAGDDTDWVPAKWWLKYGDVEQKVISLEHQDKQKDKVIGAMKNHYVRVKEDAVREVLDTIKKQKRAATQEEDFQKVAELDHQADLLQQNLENRFKVNDEQVLQSDVPTGPAPEFVSWNRENNWYKYGSTTDEMTVEADTLAIGYKTKNPNASYAEILTYVENKVKRIFPEKFKADPEPNTAVDDGGSRNTSPTSRIKSVYKLTEVEKQAAKAFDMTEAEYAKSLQEYDARKGR